MSGKSLFIIFVSFFITLGYTDNSLVLDFKSSSYNTDYLIITPNRFLTESIELAEFHNVSLKDDVINANIALLEDIMLNYKPIDSLLRHVAVNKAIQEIFEKTNEKLKYVVFIGDDSIVFDSTDSMFISVGNTPAFINNHKYGSPNNPKFEYKIYDDFYADTTGNKSFNPELALPIIIGRIPCENNEQLGLYLKKLKSYTNNFNSGEWRNRVTYLVDDNWQIYTSDNIEHNILIEEVRNNGLSSYFTNTCNSSLFKKNSDSIHVDAKNNFIDYVNSGTMWVVYSGHGHAACMSDELLLEGKDIQKLNNSSQLPVFTSFSCLNGKYVESFDGCMAKQFLFSSQGAIAYIASANVSYASSNKDFSDSLFKTVNKNPHNSLGENLFIAKMSRNGLSYVLLGDPALKISFNSSKINVEFKEINKPGDNISCHPDNINWIEGKYSYHFTVTDTVGQIYPHSYEVNLIEKIIDSGSGEFYEDFEVEIPFNNTYDEIRFKVYCWTEKNEARFDTTIIMEVPISQVSNLVNSSAIKYLNGRISLSTSNLKGSDVEFILYDLKGRTLISQEINSLASKLQLDLNDFNISTGKYIAMFRSKFETNKISILFKK